MTANVLAGEGVIDADSHVFEPDEMYTLHADAEDRALVRARPDYGLLEGGRPLGGDPGGATPVRPTEKPGTEPAGGYDPAARLRDMERQSIAKMVCFPSVVTSLCREPLEVEVAMLSAYNNWIERFCEEAPGRLYAPIVVTLRAMDRAVREVRRRAVLPMFVGVTIHTHAPERNLDDPFFDPLWNAAQDSDLPILVHSGTARPPYPLGTFELSDNFFLFHLLHHPSEQMRALAALTGGGVLERFPRLRFGFFEAGCGWVPWFVQRLSEHHAALPAFVPRLRRDPAEYVSDGRCFFSCDPDEVGMEHFIATLGEDCLLYASDYPHWDCAFPDSARSIAERTSLPPSARRKILRENALRLYRKLL
ncbi:MAG TPA: amidohydrolase family protein [Thermoanaerobaculia bacterium]|nr:amidohydrolase family protein [Thermoanaerobaculia bacterium]